MKLHGRQGFEDLGPVLPSFGLIAQDAASEQIQVVLQGRPGGVKWVQALQPRRKDDRKVLDGILEFKTTRKPKAPKPTDRPRENPIGFRDQSFVGRR